MSQFLLKSIVAVFFLVAGLTAALAMLTMMGRADEKKNPARLLRIHKGAGIVFGLLLLTLSVMCVRYWVKAGDEISLRAVLHSYLSLALLVIFCLKVIIVQFYRQLLKFVPTLGLTVLVLALVIFLSSAAYYFLRTGQASLQTLPSSPPPQSGIREDAASGERLFKSLCAGCHASDSEEWRTGPGLRGILRKDKLPKSGRPATAENILKQLQTPYLAMPAFHSLSAQDTACLLAYLKTL